MDIKDPVKVKVYNDRSYDMEVLPPITSHLILWKVKAKKGSGEPNTKKVGKIKVSDLKEIAEMKKEDMNTDDIDAIVRSLIGTAKSLGLEIVE